MEIVLHAGVHATDENRILKCLLRNNELLAKRGVAVPGPSRYRTLLREALHHVETHAISSDTRETLLDAVLEENEPGDTDRMILSNKDFFSVPRIAVNGGLLYPMAPARVAKLAAMFDGDSLELFLGIRNPATWIPAVYGEADHVSLDAFLSGVAPEALRWSELIARIRAEAPQVPITVWCNEDTPLIWGQIIREAAGLEMTQKIVGAFDLLGEIMSKEGMKRFRAYLGEHPVMTERQKRRVMVAFLDKFAIEDELEEAIDLPGWDEDRIEALTEIYDEDVYAIDRMPGVTLITP